MELKKILSGLENLKAKGDLYIDITNIESNSKKIEKGGLFVAIKGFAFDGHQYIKEAVENGAIAVMIDLESDMKSLKIPSGITVIATKGTRYALAKMACNFYDNPSKKFKLVGVTGTKGKTTTTYMIKAILEKKGLKVGLIGTIANYIGDKKLNDSSRTTPDSLELQRMFYQMANEKVDAVVMEVSSQSLKLDRVVGCNFDMAIFTNFHKDHISEKEHPDMEDYFNSKLKLFEMCDTGFVNVDDFNTYKVKSKCPKCQVKTYGIDNSCDLLAKDITITNSTVDFKVKIGDRNERVKVDIPGRFSVYNALAAICVAKKLGIASDKVIEALAEIKVPGRSEMVPNKKEIPIMIDYAHSPESLENILQAVKTYTKGRVISVFGCGGDRDRTKRPIMGRAAEENSDYVIFTDDNPRTEDEKQIMNDIVTGLNKDNHEIIFDRKNAIIKGMSMLKDNDILMILGKGHEDYQIIGTEKHHFSDQEIVRDFIKENNNA